MKIKNIYVIGLLCSLILASSCKDDDRYDPDGSVVSGKNLMVTMKENSELSSFVKIIEELGYDKVLSTNESFTVWAPKNEYMQGVSFATQEDSLRFIENHIARFLYNADGIMTDTVLMENSKLIRFIGANGSYTFGGVALDAYNIVAKNGILHIIEEQVNYAPNIWEKMEDPGFDSIRQYLYPQTVMEFNQMTSPVIDYNEDGLAVYDSVFIESNPFWNPYSLMWNGRTLRENSTLYFNGGFYPVNREDSTYTMLMPTNEAWKEAYNEVSPYFVNNTENADSVQRYYTHFAMVQDLVFRGIINPDVETLESTRLAVITNPAELFANSTREDVSNGRVYITDHLKFNSWESWHKPIKIEAENSDTYIAPPASVGRITNYADGVGDLSGSAFISNMTTGGSRTATYQEFLFPNVLAAEYNIYCVFVPDIRIPDYARSPKKTKVVFTISQLNSNGIWRPIKSGGEEVSASEGLITPADNIVSATEITKMLVYEKFKFPYAFVNADRVSIKLRVATNITSVADLGNDFINRMSIDYLILEPVHN